ncbi:DUF6125 family protein [Chloroflexota bacterium]
MTEINDYSGELQSELKFEDFSRELLLKSIEVYREYSYMIDAFWYMGVMAKRDAEEASFYNRQNIKKATEYEIDKIAKVFNIQGNDVEAYFKIMQLRPMQIVLSTRYELINPKHGIYTIVKCPVLQRVEKEGEGRERIICHKDHVESVEYSAKLFNPKMQTRPLKLPPRNSPDEIPCQWEFTMEE